MKVIVSSRRMGKTTKLIEWAQEAPEGEHRIIVSATRDRSHQQMRAAYRAGLIPEVLETWQFVSAAEAQLPGGWLAVLMGRGGHIVLGLDDCDELILRQFPYMIGLITMTADAVEDLTI